MPIATPGELDERPLIRITFGTNPPSGDNDPTIGITDGTHHNQFITIAHGSNENDNPCAVQNGQRYGRAGPLGNPVAGEYTLLFDPSRRFGSCATNNGFQSDGRFNSQIDLTKEVSLILHRNHAIEQYNFYYFLIEFL